jgi:hypothetical protein
LSQSDGHTNYTEFLCNLKLIDYQCEYRAVDNGLNESIAAA